MTIKELQREIDKLLSNGQISEASDVKIINEASDTRTELIAHFINVDSDGNLILSTYLNYF